MSIYGLIVPSIFYICCVVAAFAAVAAILLFSVAILYPLLVDFYHRAVAIPRLSGLNELFSV